MSGRQCHVCAGTGDMPVIDTRGRHLYDIDCPECFGTGLGEVSTDDEQPETTRCSQTADMFAASPDPVLTDGEGTP